MSRLQEVEKLIQDNCRLVSEYTKRAATLMGSVRQLERERERLIKDGKAQKLGTGGMENETD